MNIEGIQFERTPALSFDSPPVATDAFVVRDLADKLTGSWAVIWKMRLLPVRFATAAEAWKHVSDLRTVG
jgi:hypothetical protein